MNCSEDYITLERDKRLHTRRMGGGHQRRLCADGAGSNPAEGSADFPQARCHFSLNNSYDGCDSSLGSLHHTRFYSSSAVHILSRNSHLYRRCLCQVPGGSFSAVTGGERGGILWGNSHNAGGTARKHSGSRCPNASLFSQQQNNRSRCSGFAPSKDLRLQKQG